uniref:Uncharacterized protein n=1 Tax=Maylandia zebra TaxID=106582 RepID=A0A3P9CVL3_9CICH
MWGRRTQARSSKFKQCVYLQRVISNNNKSPCFSPDSRVVSSKCSLLPCLHSRCSLLLKPSTLLRETIAAAVRTLNNEICLTFKPIFCTFLHIK